ncbi:acetaldehyde dehydrogenase (acetylating) [Caniella muris]|uniref:acetaldehyde dehydrogenase (acetylating) n=1 Tax=Caniella muris TaxID=2941502 RepID=UPI0020420F5D|nr:acetaldehyde dehydrogenase (acetylating) [Caniella muris]
MADMDFDLKSIQAARELARRGKEAAEAIAGYDGRQIDRILRAMVEAAEAHGEELGAMAVEETGFGVAEDKAYKNHMASGLLYEQIKDKRTIGVVDVDEDEQVITIAEPVGLVLGIVPSTNPTSTVMYKALIALKARNAIVFSPHPAAAKCTGLAIKILNDAAVAAGAPPNVIQGAELLSMAATNELMHAPEVSLIIATGGPGMVKAAYSSGKPALGVGAGNSPAYIERTASVPDAVRRIIASKTFDNGIICASEQSVICEDCNRDAVVAEFGRQGGYFMTPEECAAVCSLLFRDGHAMNPRFVGRSAHFIAQAAGVSVPPGTKVLIGEQKGVGEGWPLSYEKLTCVLGFYTVSDWKEACDLSIGLLQNGIGHTMSLHTRDKDVVRRFSVKPASRILVNTGGSQGGTGLVTGLDLSFTLGCGTRGGSSVSENVGPQHLVNLKRVVNGLVEPDEAVAADELFARYHPELAARAAAVGAGGRPAGEPAVSGAAVTPGTPRSACGAGSRGAAVYATDDGGLSAADLQGMAAGLSNAFKGL